MEGQSSEESTSSTMGRPPIEMTPELCRKAKSLKTHGLSNEKIAVLIGMDVSTFYVKKRDFPEFSEALRVGDANCIAVQVSAVFERGRGCSHPEERVVMREKRIEKVETTTKMVDGKPVKTVTKTTQITKDPETVVTTKYYPPDVAANKFILTNRDINEDRTHNWKDRTQSDIVDIPLGKTGTLPEIAAAQSLLIAQVSEGKISPDNGKKISDLLDANRKAIETHDIEKRLLALEQEPKR